jgi:ribosomal-protein-alanine N-acetyltransferase
MSDPDLMKYLSRQTTTIEGSFLRLAEAIAENDKNDRKKFFFAIGLRTNDAIIGEAGFTVLTNEIKGGVAEMGYFLLKQYQGNGYATEAAELMINYCFKTLKLHKVTAGCDAQNDASVQVMKRCGMLQEAYRRQHAFTQGEWRDRLEFAILSENWLKRKR